MGTLFNERHVRKGDKGDTMGISRDSLHKRRLTGGKQKPWRKKRKYELGRQPANTKLSSHVDVRVVRCRGGNKKFRALRLDHGNFSWGSENVTRKARILDVCYNASNNELVRTKTLVKGAVIAIDASRPGQCGRCDGYILEGKELDFYVKKMQKKK